MHFTGGNTLPNIGKRVNWQLVSLASGLAIAITVAIGVGAFDGGSRNARVVQDIPQALPETAGSITTAVRPVVYIVDSEAQATALQESIALDEMATALEGGDPVVRPTSFVVIDSPEREYLYNAVVGDQMLANAFDIVDLRDDGLAVPTGSSAAATETALPIVYIVGSQAQADELQADIAADQIEALRQGQAIAVRDISFVVAEPGDDEFLLNLITGPLGGATFDIVDAR